MRTDRRLLVIAAAALAAIGIWTSALLPGGKTLDLTVMDVGEGLCVVMRTPSNRVMVMDCGTSSWRKNDTVGESVVVPYLHRMGKNTIDLAVLSHPHSDHVSGYAGLLEAVPAKVVMDIEARHASPLYKRFIKRVKLSNATYRIAKRGQNIEMGDGVSIHVLSPNPKMHYSDLNNNSIVLRIVYGKTAILLAADAEDEAEQDILESGIPVRAQVLQVGHHGAKAASSTQWLNAVRPAIAIISCGRHNNYGHPSSEAVERLESSGARVYRTDRCGAVTITSDGRTIRAKTCSTSR
ncbi:MBL fold metallo-hydrolase [bacterium]|nr:MBL fold metallo-hydrolase [bacterium]